MKPFKPVKPRSSKEKKKLKVSFLQAVFTFVDRLDKAFKAIESLYETVKPYLTLVWEQLSRLGDF
jgi:hypothetical protein